MLGPLNANEKSCQRFFKLVDVISKPKVLQIGLQVIS